MRSSRLTSGHILLTGKTSTRLPRLKERYTSEQEPDILRYPRGGVGVLVVYDRCHRAPPARCHFHQIPCWEEALRMENPRKDLKSPPDERTPCLILGSRIYTGLFRT